MKRNLRCLLSLLFSTLPFIPLGGARGESLWESQFSWQADRQGVVLKDGGGTVRLASPEEGLWEATSSPSGPTASALSPAAAHPNAMPRPRHPCPTEAS
ncbi:MAG: hypothetical protein IJG02_08815 [Thermoguttaceae bacterium]|nr:hypothetical protein [Thermoguttaceae bacterium]